MVRACLVSIVAAVLVGCAPSYVAGNALSVTYTDVNSDNMRQTFAAAEAHCAQHGKLAKPDGSSHARSMTFDCVKPD